MPGPVYKPKPNQHIGYPRLDKFVQGWLLGEPGLKGLGKQLAQNFDPRTKAGLLNAMAMLVPGKGSGDNAMAAFLGHSDFRGYNPMSGYNEATGGYTMSDPIVHGGASAFKSGADYGYPSGLSRGNFRAVHGFSLPELLGLAKSQRIVSPHVIKDAPGAGGFLHAPYRYQRNFRN